MSDYIEAIDFHRYARKEAQRNRVQKSSNAGIFQVKKRAQYENEIIKCEMKLDALPIMFGDRFIPRRYFRKQTTIRPFVDLSETDENENDIFAVKKQPFYWRLHNYRINIGEQLGFSNSGKILNLHDVTTQQECNRKFNRNPMQIKYQVGSRSAEELDWPCMPRAKPLSYNDSTHGEN